MSGENKENDLFTPYIPEYLHSVKSFYFIDKIKKYMNAEKRYPEDIYNFVEIYFLLISLIQIYLKNTPLIIKYVEEIVEYFIV